MSLLSVVLKVRRRKTLGYAVAILTSALALWVRMQLGPNFEGFPYLTFFPAVLFTALVGGLGPGLIAAILSGLLAQYFLIPPIHSLEIRGISEWIAMGLYGAIAASMVGLVHGITLAYEAHRSAEQRLAEVNAALEQRVVERTAELRAEVEERLAAESQVRQLQKMDAVGQLTGGVAHDFNNMLAIVIGSLELAKVRAEVQPDERITRYINAAQEGAQRAALLTARLMAFARQQPLAPQAVDVNKLVQGMSELLRRTLGEPIRIEAHLATRIWHCFADVSQLENALVNLCINARDAMPGGGRLTIETANVELGAEGRQRTGLPAGQYVQIVVADSGTGMSPGTVEKAFDPFYTTKGVGKGTGLGLSQVYGYLRQSGGTALIRSEVGVGTAIELYLPRFVGQSDHEGPGPSPDRPARATEGHVVLVVEDEPQVRQMAVDALAELGYDALPAASADEALAHLQQRARIDLLLTDVMMPGVSGPALAAQASTLRPGMKVLYMSGFAPELLAGTHLSAGVKLLPKPFTISQLAAKVSEAITRP